MNKIKHTSIMKCILEMSSQSTPFPIVTYYGIKAQITVYSKTSPDPRYPNRMPFRIMLEMLAKTTDKCGCEGTKISGNKIGLHFKTEEEVKFWCDKFNVDFEQLEKINV